MIREKYFIFVFFILIAMQSVSASVVINEVLPNPDSDWNGNGVTETYGDEWIELYADSEQSLNGWIIGDKVKNYTFQNTSICSDCFLILYGNISSLQLNNNDEEIYLYDSQGLLIDTFPYDSSEKDISLCRYPDASDDIFSCSPTRGSENFYEEQEEEEQEQENQTETDSYLQIVESPEEAEFGELIDIQIKAYKGDTSKYAVYLWIENFEEEITEKLTLHLKDKFTDYELKVPVQIKSDCNNEYEEGNYTIILEGLDKETKKNITLEGNNDYFCSLTQSNFNGGTEYEIDRPSSALIGEEIPVSILIKNNRNEQQEFDVWAYISKDGKCYSNQGNEQSNLQHITISKHSEEFVQLRNTVEGAEEGAYNLKIIIKQGSNERGFANDITLQYSADKKLSEMLGRENILNQEQLPSKEQEQKREGITGQVVYLSKSEETKNKAVLFFAFLCLIVALYFITKKEKCQKKSVQ